MSSSKITQRQLNKFLQEFAARSSVVALIEGMEEATEVEIFVNPSEALSSTEGDLEEIRELGEKALRYLSRSKGKRALAQEELQAWQNAISNLQNASLAKRPAAHTEEDARDSAESSGRKRSKGVEGGGMGEESLDKASKDELKVMFRQISAKPEAEDFMYPVDRSLYPEYYEVIKNPMDLTTWSKGIAKYASLHEALSSLRLIWANCLKFNRASSDIAIRAVKVGQFAEKLIEEKFGKKAMDMSWKKAAVDVSSPEDRKAPAAAPAESKATVVATFKQLIRNLGKSDFADPFLQPVREEDAPGYFDVISEPMDLTSLRKRVSGGHYNDLDDQKALEAFAHDLNLLWQNCLAYNNPQSQIAQWALSLLEDAKK
eukprot:gene29914-36127_t